jgi:phosphoserine phosphatase RsbU/P
MKIRNKLTGLLLGVSILPILAMALLLQMSMHRLSDRISVDIQDALIRDVNEQVRVHLHNYHDAISAASASLLLTVKLQAAEIEKCLKEKTTSEGIDTNKPFGFDPAIVDVAPAHGESASAYRNNVDFRRQDFFLRDTGTRDQAQQDLVCLQKMTPVYHHLYQANFAKTLWHYTSLENGVHTVYPAGGSLPEDYDPQHRTWYVAASKQPPSWASCMEYDAATNILVLTISAPVFRPDGAFAGVTAIDMPMNHLVEGLALPSALSGKVKVFLAGLGQPGGPITAELRQYMQAQNQQDHVSWNVEPEFQALISADHESYEAMIQDLLAGRSGIRILDYLGEKSIWGYSERIGEKMSLHMAIPYEHVLQLASQARHSVLNENKHQIKMAGFFLAGIIAMTALTGFLYARRFTDPIRQLAEATQQLSQGNFETQAHLKTGDELETLAMVLNDVGPRLKAHEKTQRNLALAGAIQKNLLPAKPPVLSNFEIAGRCLYCDETGGDYFDFIVSADNDSGKRVSILLGDVTGHGISAALLMASARSLLRNASGFLAQDLTGIMKLFNDRLTEDTEDDKFMTLFYGIINDADRSMVWASGGHDPAIWFHRKTKTFEELPNTGPLMGMMKGLSFEQAGPICFETGDLLIIGTDGIWEAQNSKGEDYGKARLNDCIASHFDQSAECIASSIIDSVKTFTAPRRPEDDITLIVIKTQ